MGDFARILRTVRHLYPRQVAHRVARRAFPLRNLPPPRADAELRRRDPVPPAVFDSHGYDGNSLLFLNRRHRVDGEDRWNPLGAERLWVYNLHYFQYLGGLSGDQGRRLVLDWISKNDSAGSPGWEPYPLSLRIREWTEWLLANPGLDPSMYEKAVQSLVQQTEALQSQLEYDLMGNHLLENGVTLCWTGLSMLSPQSGGWLRRGLSILRDELQRQILPDGTHDERSPMYQALLTEGLCRLCEVARQSEGPEAAEVERLAGSRAHAMLASLERLIHPDGGYALLNDSALGIAPPLAALRARFGGVGSAQPVEGAWSLKDAGYFGRTDGGEHLIFDAGPIGPDHQPGHGHADTLAFELSLHGRRVLTDTGVFTYEEGARRRYDRSTAAHNTIEVDGLDQSELWAAFRCGHRTRAEEATQTSEGEVQTLRGRYVGHGSSSGRTRHSRVVRRGPEAYGFVDQVWASGAHVAKLHLHVAPGLTLRRQGARWELRDGKTPIASVAAEGFDWHASTSPYHPEFGLEIERPQLSAELPFGDRLHVAWTILLH